MYEDPSEVRQRWLNDAMTLHASHIIVIFDAAERDYYPVYANAGEVRDKTVSYGKRPRTHVSEIIVLNYRKR
jgi:hypothetical protein